MYGSRTAALMEKLINAAVDGLEKAVPLRTRTESAAHAAAAAIAQSSLLTLNGSFHGIGADLPRL